MKMEAEVREMHPDAEIQGTQGRQRVPLRPREEPTLLPASRTETIHSCCLRHLVCGTL